MKVTVNEAFNANGKLQKKRLPTGQVDKPALLNAKGDAGMAIYFLKHAIADTFGAHFERIRDLLQEKEELKKERAELQEKQQDNKTGLSKKDADRLEEIQDNIQEVNDDLDGISQKEVELDIKKEIPFQGIKNLADVDTLEALDFAIDFGKEEPA